MTHEIIRIKSIAELHQRLGLGKPLHPLISLVNLEEMNLQPRPKNQKVVTDLYTIWLKDSSCGMLYGRKHVDFTDGVLLFIGPDQVITSTGENQDHTYDRGWLLGFHPDLIRGFPLAEQVSQYNFFSYEADEALHLSEAEERTITDVAENIRAEYEQRIDNHSQKVMVASLDLLLSYCNRYYDRQFITRASSNKGVVVEVEKTLKEYFGTDQALEYGVPSIHYLADKVNLSPGYLSDLLKKETGRSGKEHINYFLVEKAKNLLLSTNDTVNQIADMLGFNYPHYFSRLFKAKTGLTPQQYREGA